MYKPLIAALIACASSQAGAYPTRFPVYEPQYIFDGQYTAALQQHAQQWRLLPLRGDEVDVSTARCANANVPRGLWYVSPDGDGKLQLVAPSVTSLPKDFPERVTLRRCGEQADTHTTLFIPAEAFDWIAANAGTVLIDD